MKQSDDADTTTMAIPPQTPLTRTDKGRVLIVNDSHIDGSIITLLLQDHGYETRLTKTAREALSVLENDEFDLMCLDVQLPDLDGFALTRQIWESRVHGHTPILLVSAEFTDEHNVVRGLQAGANDYVRVPFAHVEFLGRVDVLHPDEDGGRPPACPDSRGPVDASGEPELVFPACAGGDVLCTLAAVGPWHQHEAESRVDWGGSVARGVGYGLAAFTSRAMTSGDDPARQMYVRRIDFSRMGSVRGIK